MLSVKPSIRSRRTRTRAGSWRRRATARNTKDRKHLPSTQAIANRHNSQTKHQASSKRQPNSQVLCWVVTKKSEREKPHCGETNQHAPTQTPCNQTAIAVLTQAQTRQRLTAQPAQPLTAPHTHVPSCHQHWHSKASIVTQTLCWVDLCFGVWVLLGLFSLLRVTHSRLGLPTTRVLQGCVVQSMVSLTRLISQSQSSSRLVTRGIVHRCVRRESPDPEAHPPSGQPACVIREHLN